MQHALPDQILKVDRLGRVRVPEERREALLDEFERCGVSASQFATVAGVNYQTFATWVQRRRKERVKDGVHTAVGPLAEPDRMQWIEAVVGEPRKSDVMAQSKQRLIVSLPGGAKLEIEEAGQIALAAELLRLLSGKEGVEC